LLGKGVIRKMANKYCNLQGTQKISESYHNINTGFDQVENDIEENKTKIHNHINGVSDRHDAEVITYSGIVPGATNVKQAIDNTRNRVEEIITTPAESVSAQEIIDARGGYISLGGRLDEFESQMAEKAKDIVDLREMRWGVRADGETDDTIKFEEALQYATDYGCKVLLPKGIIKITRPVVIKYYERDGVPLSVPPLSFSMEGLGGISGGILKSYGSLIRAYNIPDGRSAIELLGKNNGLITSVEMSNLQISLDHDTCGELSFCLTIGDAWIFTLRRVKFTGFNSVLLRCGTAEGANSYSNIACKFDQCVFITNRYVGWDGTTIDEKSKFGFAIANERMFYDNGYIEYPSDSLTFDTCFFGGTVFNYAVNSLYLNCMWYIPGGYKPEINADLDQRFNSNFIKGIIDNRIGLWNAGGCATMINPYFEDVPKCVYIKSFAGHDVYTKLIQPLILGTLNVVPEIEGVLQGCVYCVKAEIPTGANSSISIEGGTYSKGNTGFSEGFVINNGCRDLIIDNVHNVKEEDIKDYASQYRNVKINNLDYEKNLILEFEGKADSLPLKLKDIGTNIYTFKHDYNLSKIEMITSSYLTEPHSIILRINGEDYFSIKWFGPNVESYIEKQQGSEKERYIFENVSYTSVPNYPVTSRRRKFFKGNELSLVIGVNNYPSADADIDVTVKLHFKS